MTETCHWDMMNPPCPREGCPGYLSPIDNRRYGGNLVDEDGDWNSEEINHRRLTMDKGLYCIRCETVFDVSLEPRRDVGE